MGKLKENNGDLIEKVKPSDAVKPDACEAVKPTHDTKKVINALKGLISTQRKEIEALKKRIEELESSVVEFMDNYDAEITRLDKRVHVIEQYNVAKEKKKWWKFF